MAWPKQRDWGWYATLVRLPWLCVKVLRFKAYGSLSHQRHNHRTEIWLFLRGGGKKRHNFDYSLNTKRIWLIEKGDWHKFNAFEKPVYALELQYGRKVTEKDIERR